jgi:F-type H+-transporting ATPase subunit O
MFSVLQAPLQLFGVEGRYAHALYSAASKEKKLDAVEKDLKNIQVCTLLHVLGWP